MQIIGFNFQKIQAERKKTSAEGKLEISSNINVKEITQEKVSAITDKPVLKFEFEFSVDYKPGVAEIRLQGFILALVEKDEAKAVLKKWKKKEILNELRVPLFNVILTKSNLRALQLEEELNLPTHIPLPRVKPQDQVGTSQQTSQGAKRSYAG